MEPSDPPPAPASEPGAAADEPSSPILTTPVVVALLGLCGVLGGALITNWDKVFGAHHAKPAAVAATTTASVPGTTAPDLQRLHGVWLGPVSVHPFQADRRFRLRLVLNSFGGEISGQVSDVPEGSSSGGATFEIVSPKAVGEGLDFQVSSTWCCEDGKEKPYQVFYQLRPTSQGLAVTRRNNAPGGGQVERFLLERSG
jgi:hypothetical protein